MSGTSGDIAEVWVLSQVSKNKAWFKAMTDLLPQLRAEYDKRLQEEVARLSAAAEENPTAEGNEGITAAAGTESKVSQDVASAIAEAVVRKLKA